MPMSSLRDLNCDFRLSGWMAQGSNPCTAYIGLVALFILLVLLRVASMKMSVHIGLKEAKPMQQYPNPIGLFGSSLLETMWAIGTNAVVALVAPPT